MHPIVPAFIQEHYLAGEMRGDFQAVGLFLDVSGFSKMTDVLMVHGGHGAEVLAEVIRAVFDPLINHIYAQGGFVAGSAGDSLTALFPVRDDLLECARRAAAAAWSIQQEMLSRATFQTVYQNFPVSVKVGLADGPVQWGIITASSTRRGVYYFQGQAVDGSAQAEQQAQAGQIILSRSLAGILGDWITTTPGPEDMVCLDQVNGCLPAPAALPEPVLIRSALTQFFPDAVIDQEISGEFRQIVNLLISLPWVRTETQLRIFMENVFALQNTYGGLINKLDFGDKGTNLVMFWGMPAANENDIDRALNFILTLQEVTSIPISAGITYRIAHAGFIGGRLHEEYTCFGRGVNLAARFMTSAPRGEIWVDEQVNRRASQHFNIEYVEERRFKGFSQPQQVFVLLERKEPEASFFQGSLVGRDADRAALSAFLQPIFQGQFAGMMVVSGEPGMGKSRLVHTFLADLEAQTPGAFQMCLAQTDEIMRQPFNPFIYWLRRYFGINETQGEARSKRSFNRKLDELVGAAQNRQLADELDRTRSFLGALIGLHWADSLYEQLDAQGRYTNTFIALAALIQAESQRLPLVLVLEDIHHLDEDSQAFLPYLMRILADQPGAPCPVALLSTSRQPPQETAWMPAGCQSLPLEGLDRASLSALAADLLGGAPAPALLDLLAERAEGNPFHAEQMLLYLKEENQLVHRPEGWNYHRRQLYALPDNINSLMISRLDHLTHKVKETVQTAAVLGREFDIPLLNCMLKNCDTSGALPEVSSAEREGIWAQLSEIRYIFKHILMREAAYQMQVHARRQHLHALALEAYETLYQNDLRSHYADLAYHAEQAARQEPARRYLRQAGEAACDAYQNSQAVEFFTRALDLTPAEAVEARAELLLAREAVFVRLGRTEERQRDLEALSALSPALSGVKLRVEILLRHSLFSVDTGAYSACDEIAKEALALALSSGLDEEASRACKDLSMSAMHRGRLEAAEEYAREGIRLAGLSGGKEAELTSYNNLGLIAYDQGRMDLAQQSFSRALKIAQEIGNPGRELGPLNNLAMVLTGKGDLAGGFKLYQQAEELGRKIGNRLFEGVALGNMGFVTGQMGEYAAALNYLGKARQISHEVGASYSEAFVLVNMSASANSLGDFEEAGRLAQEAYRISHQNGERSGEAWGQTHLGHSLLALNRLAEAAEAYGLALAIREELNQPDLATEPAAGLALTALAQGNLTAARAALEPVLAYLDGGGTLAGTDEPLRVYLVCWKVLNQAGDPRARDILGTAYRLLHERAASIPKEAARQSFFTKIAHHREIQAAWENQN